jgi:SAM-dependent methyltransferase
MCSVNCLMFVAKNLVKQEVERKRVLEVGSFDVNGSVRPIIQLLGPDEYIGVDMEMGPGVDRICLAENLIHEFGRERFDLVVATELLEHVRDWQTVISNIKKVCSPGGIVLATTRSYGYPYHAVPQDYWRYEPDDMRKIFSDCEILALQEDPSPSTPGVFIKLRKPQAFVENVLLDCQLYSIVVNRRVKTVTDSDLHSLHFRHLLLRLRLTNFAHMVVNSVFSRL